MAAELHHFAPVLDAESLATFDEVWRWCSDPAIDAPLVVVFHRAPTLVDGLRTCATCNEMAESGDEC